MMIICSLEQHSIIFFTCLKLVSIAISGLALQADIPTIAASGMITSFNLTNLVSRSLSLTSPRTNSKFLLYANVYIEICLYIKLSNTVTLNPLSKRISVNIDPKYPAPPVIKILII